MQQTVFSQRCRMQAQIVQSKQVSQECVNQIKSLDTVQTIN